MGCCFSRPQGPNSPYPGGPPQSGSARAINSPARRRSSVEEGTAASSGTSHRRQRRHHNQPLDQHINKPLRLVLWTSRDKRWTKSLLNREREAFFDTRVTGRQEIWQTIRTALELTQTKNASHTKLEENMATAQTILSAAEITLPTGNLANGAYDALGNYYPIPEYVVSDPTNIVDDEVEAHRQHGKQTLSVDEGSDNYDDTVDSGQSVEEELERRREEKGKGVAHLHEQITINARLSENGLDIKVSIDKKDTVKVLSRKILVESGLPSSKRIRVAYMGKILKENISLLDQGFKQGHLVNALVFSR